VIPVERPLLVATVVPDVTGLDKVFDYLVPSHLADRVDLGSMVRVPLAGRRVGGWITALGDRTDVDVGKLQPIAKVSGRGPSDEVIRLGEWAAHRWGAGRLRPFLVSASPATMVPSARVPVAHTSMPEGAPGTDPVSTVLADGGGVIRVAPTDDPVELIERVVAAAGRAGSVLVVHPSPHAASLLAARLRRGERRVATWPEHWAAAAAGVDIVIGGRSAVWATLPVLSAIVVLDEHDEALQEERTPTWHARDVAIERARRNDAPIVLVSPCPTVAALAWSGRRWLRPEPDAERDGWPSVTVVDRRDEEPWKRSLVSTALVEVIRDATLRVACVHNTPGRSRLLACRRCRSLLVCERCEASVRQRDDATLACGRCGAERPPVCQACGASAIANVKPGVTRVREELEAAAARPIDAVTGASDQRVFGRGDGADVVVGTEAVLHRMRDVDVVVFLDLDAELLAPRYRAGEQTMALLVRAARLVGADGSVIVQTHVPDHEVLGAVAHTDPGRLARAEAARRRLLGLPPFGALARLSGDGVDELVELLAPRLDVQVGRDLVGDGDRWLARAADWDTLGDALTGTAAPMRAAGRRVRIEVDPPR
jgi:primosomal protein N' (replication factor Y) (superfamily II helicase)